jgi:hypothetical protein
MTYMIRHKEHLWNVNVLQKVHFSNLDFVVVVISCTFALVFGFNWPCLAIDKHINELLLLLLLHFAGPCYKITTFISR